MKALLLFFALFITGNLYCQNWELSVDHCDNGFSDIFGGSHGHYSAKYTFNPSICTGIGLAGIQLNDNGNRLTLDFMLSYSQHDGNLWMYSGGRGGGTDYSLDIKKHLINFAVYPFHLRMFKKRLKINFGSQYSTVIGAHMKGRSTTRTIAPSYSESEIETNSHTHLAKFRIGLNARISYSIKLFKQLNLLPTITYSKGVNNEYPRLPKSVFLNTLQFGIRLQRAKIE